MKEGWEIKKLLDVVDFQRGLTYTKNDEVDFSENMVLRSNNVDLKTNKLFKKDPIYCKYIAFIQVYKYISLLIINKSTLIIGFKKTCFMLV